MLPGVHQDSMSTYFLYMRTEPGELLYWCYSDIRLNGVRLIVVLLYSYLRGKLSIPRRLHYYVYSILRPYVFPEYLPAVSKLLSELCFETAKFDHYQNTKTHDFWLPPLGAALPYKPARIKGGKLANLGNGKTSTTIGVVVWCLSSSSLWSCIFPRVSFSR